MRERFVVNCTLLGGFRGALVRTDIIPTWEVNDAGVYQQVPKPNPVFDHLTKAFGDEVSPADFAHSEPHEFDRLLSIGAIRRELTEEAPMGMAPQPPPAKGRTIQEARA